jgi:hypothetical protein
MSWLLVTADGRVLSSKDVADSHPALARIIETRETMEEALAEVCVPGRGERAA